MVLYKLGKELVVLVLKHVVIADAAADKHLFYARDGSQLAQKRQVIRVVGIEIFARVRRKAALVRTHAVFVLLVAGVVAEVCRRAADIVYVALEIGQLRERRDLTDDAFVAAARDHSALVER